MHKNRSGSERASVAQQSQWRRLRREDGQVRLGRSLTATNIAREPRQGDADIVFCPLHTNAGEEKGGRLSEFQEAVSGGVLEGWTCKSTARPGDVYVFYFGAPEHRIVALGICATEPDCEDGPFEWTNARRAWFCDFDPVLLLDAALTKEAICADVILADWWRSAPYRGRPKTIPNNVAQRLLELLLESNASAAPLLKHHVREPVAGLASQVRPPPAAETEDEITSLDHSSEGAGSGFGDPESNQEVETSAVAWVTSMLARDGWSVRSRESERIGYDLECTKDASTRHVEVKGVRGTEVAFLVTARELENARIDPCFEIHVVTEACSGNPTVQKWSGAELLELFELRPIQFSARLSSATGLRSR